VLERIGPARLTEPSGVDVVDQLEPLRDDWCRLTANATNIFATWEWNDLWWAHYGRDRPLRLGVATHDGAVEGVVPLFQWTGRPLRVLRLLGHGHGDRLGPICESDEPERAERVLRGALAAIPHDVFVGDWLPGGRGWADALGGRVLRTTGYPILALEGRSWDEILAGTSPRFRKHVRQSRNRLERRHDVRFRAPSVDTLESDLDTLFGLHRARFGEQHQGCHFCGEYEPFQRDFANLAFDRGWLRLLLLELDGEAVAAEFGFVLHGIYFAYQGARNPVWQRESVGFVLEVETIRRTLAEGAVEFRFLGGEEAYKYRFRTQDPRLENVLAGRTARGRFATAAVATAWRAPGGEALMRRVASV
jgi:CelD/BcsL family acetyltransferase involved in cellulose biosynthesis